MLRYFVAANLAREISVKRVKLKPTNCDSDATPGRSVWQSLVFRQY